MNKFYLSLIVLFIIGVLNIVLYVYVEINSNDIDAAPPLNEILEKRLRLVELSKNITEYIELCESNPNIVTLEDGSKSIILNARHININQLLRLKKALMHVRSKKNHLLMVNIYSAVADCVENNISVITEPSEAFTVYDDLLWIARDHGIGVSEGVKSIDIERWFQCAKKYCISNHKNQIVHFYFEHASFVRRRAGREAELDILMEGLQYIGHNHDRDGSLYHEIGMVKLALAQRSNDLTLRNESIEYFNKAIDEKKSCNNSITPLISQKMIVQAKSEIYLITKNREIVTSLDQYIDRVVSGWDQEIEKFSDDNRSSYHELLMNAAFIKNEVGNKEQSLNYFKKALVSLKKYDGQNTMINKLEYVIKRLSQEIDENVRVQ